MKHLLDTDWVVDYLKGRKPIVERLATLSHEGLAISLITYGEMYEGIYFGRDPQRHEAGFRKFLRGVTVLPLDRTIMRGLRDYVENCAVKDNSSAIPIY